MTTILRGGIAALAVASMAGCMTGPPPAEAYGMADDGETVRAVRARFAGDPLLSRHPIGIASFHGHVTLSGVAPADVRAGALAAARGTLGVRSVADEMTPAPWGVPGLR